MPATEEQKAALFNAAEEGDLEQFQTAAAAIDGTDIKQLHAANGANCLHIAAHAGQTELCNYLLDTLSFDINSQDEGGKGSTPLVLAVAGKHWATADALLERSPDVNRQGGSGGAAAPLHLAVAEGRAELVQRLLEAGALPNAPSGSGTPLMLAAARANAAVVDLLLRHGADPREAAPNGLTPLFMAITLGGDAEVVRRLVAAGADVNARALGAFTPLHVAAEGGKAEVARLLLEAGADPDARDEHGHTPARVAGMHSHREVVELLLRRGGDGGAATAAAGASAGAADGAQSLDDFLASSRAALREREARAAAAAPAAPAASSRSASSAVRIPQPEVPDEGLADTFKRKGNEFFVAGDYEGAAKLYELALSHWTQNPTVWSNRAACLLRLGRHQKALQDAQVARTLDPKYVKAWYREGRAAEGLRDWEVAATAFYQAAQLQPESDEFIRLTKEMIVKGRKALQAQQAGGAAAGAAAAAAGEAAAAAAAAAAGETAAGDAAAPQGADAAGGKE